jgi:TctA family transporter
MIFWWIGNLVLLFVVAPVVAILLKGVLTAARSIVPNIQAIAVVGTAINRDLDPVYMLLTTQASVIKTVEVVANYGGSLDVILDDA